MHVKVYHVLPEAEPFSACAGGAISRWVARVAGNDPRTTILAPTLDGSWDCGSVARVLPFYRGYGALLTATRNRLPYACRLSILRRVFATCLEPLHRGDTLWIHNRPL